MRENISALSVMVKMETPKLRETVKVVSLNHSRLHSVQNKHIS